MLHEGGRLQVNEPSWRDRKATGPVVIYRWTLTHAEPSARACSAF